MTQDNRRPVLVSIVIPTYNRSNTILDSARSVLAQDIADLEVIIVDDGSQDDTVAKISSIEDERIRIISLDKNIGAAAARNKGVEASKGKYIAFCDSDDQWLQGHLGTALFALEGDSANVATACGYVLVQNGKARLGGITKGVTTHQININSLLYRNYVGTPTLVVRTSAIKKIGGFDERLPRYQDWDLALRLLSVGGMKFIAETRVVAKTSRNSISNSKKRYYEAISIIEEKHRNHIKDIQSIKPIWDCRRGLVEIHEARYIKGATPILRALIQHPFLCMSVLFGKN